MKAIVRLRNLVSPLLLNAAALSTSAVAQGVLEPLRAASAPMLREPPGYPIDLVAITLFGLFALLGLLATLVVVSNARRDKRLEAQVDELMRANARRVDSHEADQLSRRP